MHDTPAIAEVNYNGVAWIYDALGTIYSLGQISAAKVSQAAHLAPGDKVLYVGVGAGEDALAAARRGVHVTCLDLSAGMLHRAQQRMEREGLSGEFICGDVLEHRRAQEYDAVAANFFFNVFSEQVMRDMLEKVVQLVKPGGRLFIADFSLPQGGRLRRVPQVIYHGISNGFYWMLGLCDRHPAHDYCRHLREAGLQVESVEYFRPLPVGRGAYSSICARLPAGQ